MALMMAMYDLPTTTEMEQYVEWAMGTVNTILQQVGVQEIRAYRNPLRTTPQVMAHYEFDCLASCWEFIQSEDYARIIAEAQTLGIQNVSVQVWDASPAMPEPSKPSR